MRAHDRAGRECDIGAGYRGGWQRRWGRGLGTGWSAAHLLMMESTMTCSGFWSDSRCTMSMACFTMRTAISFLPLLRPCIISAFTSLREEAGGRASDEGPNILHYGPGRINALHA